MTRAFAQPEGSLGILDTLLGHIGPATRRYSVEWWDWGGGRKEGRRRGSKDSPPRRKRQQGGDEGSSGVRSDNEAQTVN